VAGIDYADDEVIAIDRVIGRELQAALNAAGFYVGEPYGIIGPRSIKAITDWQSEEGFVATGTLTRSQAALLLGYNLP
jgi:peptidoglycan hydrolase-like protein with peptidoglycan-binding domain